MSLGAAILTAVLAYAAGDVAECKSTPQKSAAAKTAKMIPSGAVVFVVGDTTYPVADRATLQSCYTPTWGQFLSRTYAVPGNHDYQTAGASGYYGYFGAAAGGAGQGYYSYDVGAWHLVALNSNCTQVSGSCAAAALIADSVSVAAPSIARLRSNCRVIWVKPSALAEVI